MHGDAAVGAVSPPVSPPNVTPAKRSAVQQQHALARSRTPGQGVRDGHGLSMAAGGPVLVEEKISADEAIALIGKAKTIVEADMGAKVRVC